MKKTLPLLLTILSFSSYAQVDLQLGLQGFWELDNNGLDSLGLHTGTVVGAQPSTDRCGFANSALSFSSNATTFVNIGDNLDNIFTNHQQGFSITAWIRPNGLINNKMIVAKDGDIGCNMDERQFYLRLYPAGRLNFSYYMTLEAYDHRLISGNTVMSNPDRWYLVAVTYNPTSNTNNGLDRVKLYVDGVPENTSMQQAMGPLGHIQNGPAPLSVGAYLSSFQTICSQPMNFDGSIDEVRVYDRILSDAEVLALYTFPCAVGIDEPTALPIQIFPNPTEGIFVISGGPATMEGRVEVYNLGGQLVTTVPWKEGVELDLQNHPSGMYIVRVTWDSGQHFTSKILSIKSKP